MDEARTGPEGVVCSSRGCRDRAVWSLRWNNPRLHPPERRKTWLACDGHRGSLGDVLDARGFLREVTLLDGGTEAGPPGAVAR